MRTQAGAATATPADGLEGGQPGDLFAHGRSFADMDLWHRRVAKIRRDTPVFRAKVDGYAPFWVLTRHADVVSVSRDSRRWVNTAQSVLVREQEWHDMLAAGIPEPRTLIHLDGQAHRDHRQVTSDWFRAAAVKERQERIDSIAAEFVEKMRAMGGVCDFARDVAQPYALRVIMDIYGVPNDDEPLMLELTQGMFGASDPEFMGDAADVGERLIESVTKFVGYFGELAQDRQACPRDDLASVIANGTPGGCPMGQAEMLWYFIVIATAGHDTTSYALSGGLEAMLRDPSQIDAIRNDPSLAGPAADECIRWATPVRHFLRYATEDAEVGGVTISSGERVLLSYPSANRDETVFQEPDVFDIRRPDADKQLAFGIGSHHCLGSHVARREISTILMKLATELDHLELAGPARWSESPFVSGVKNLPIAYSFRT